MKTIFKEDRVKTGNKKKLLCMCGTLLFVFFLNQAQAQSWQPMPIGETYWLTSVWGNSGSDVFVVGPSGHETPGTGTILHYNGIAWSAMKNRTDYGLTGVWGASGSDVFAVGPGGTILHYNGIAWSAMPSGIDKGLNRVWGSSGRDVFAVGDSGTILHYNGRVWAASYSASTESFKCVWGSSASDVFAVGDKGLILHYNGKSWTAMDSGTTTYLTSVWGSSCNDVYAVGEKQILHYDGQAWSSVFIGTSEETYQSIWGSSDGDVFVAGSINDYNGRIVQHKGCGKYDEEGSSQHAIIFNYLPEGKVLSYKDFTCLCTAFPEKAKIAMQYAANILQRELKIDVPIEIDVCWAKQDSDPGSSSQIRNHHLDADIYYPSSVANKKAGKDLYPGETDGYIIFKGGDANKDNDYYFETDGKPKGKYDLVTVTLHETIHILGFTSGLYVEKSSGRWRKDKPYKFDTFLVDDSEQSLIDPKKYPNPSSELGNALTGGWWTTYGLGRKVYFNGANAVKANNGEKVKLNTPEAWDNGNSVCHLQSLYHYYTAESLMADVGAYGTFKGNAYHTIGPVTKGILQDIGWSIR